MGKVAVDFITWLTDPAAIVNSWAQRTWGVRNARGQRKAYFDHLGHPAGRIVKWTEDWAQALNVANDAQTGAGGPLDFGHTTQRGWVGTVTGSGGLAEVSVQSPNTTRPQGHVKISVGTGAVGNDSKLSRPAQFIYNADIAAAVEFDIWPGTVGVADSQIYCGFGNAKPTSTAFGGWLYTDGTTNWKAVASSGSALSSVVDTGVAVGAGAWQQMRVEWWGANVADDSANAFRMYIGGTLVATITTNLPTTLNAITVAGANKLAGSTQLTAYVGPVQFSSNY